MRLDTDPANASAPSIDDDPRLLAAARLGDERAYGRLVEHHREGLERFCELMLGCPDKAHEAVQEALLRGWQSRAGVDPQTSARIWLYRLATRVCLQEVGTTDEVGGPRPLNPSKDHQQT